MNKGFTLIETLITSLFIPMIMTFVLGMLVLMNKFELDALKQADVFKVQLRQMLSRSKIIECDEELIFTKNSKEFELTLHENRIVKTPGFEILLYKVDDLFFYGMGDSCMINYLHDGKEEVIEIRYQY